ncbi:MAG TPA: pseudouridine synthase [Opitutaceae bacterium]|nr:pseudouridine synthase [Opitutaceae bacterium]
MKRRLDQLLASSGLGSRSEVKELIQRRRVTVAGVIERNPATKAAPAEVLVDGAPLEFPDGLFVLFHKPAGCVCSHDTREGQRIYDLLPPRWLARNPAVTSVGRLDRDTTGLLLLTDDTRLVHRLTSPKHHVDKVYEATLDRAPEPGLIEAFASGTLLLAEEEKPCAPARLVLRGGGEIELTLTEGRFHQVKRMFAHFGYEVRRLHRSRFGEYTLGDLAPGQWRASRPPA